MNQKMGMEQENNKNEAADTQGKSELRSELASIFSGLLRLFFDFILSSKPFKEDFIARHTRMIILVVTLIFFFIGNRYACQQKYKEIDKLQQQLQDVRFEWLSISSELTGKSRQSQIEELIEEQGIDLEGAQTPPYKLERSWLKR